QRLTRLSLDQDWPEQVLAFQRQVWLPFLGEEGSMRPVSARETSGLQLFRHFIGEVELALAEQVIVIPDGPLWNLPFDLLQVPEKNSPYWIEKHAYSLAYSGSWWYELSSNRAESTLPNGMLAMAPDFPLVPPPNNLLASRGFLGPLLNNRAEALMLKDRYRAQVFLDGEANLNNFRAQAGKHRIIHLSTHGLAAEEDMALSLLAFAAPGDTLVLAQDSFPRIGALFAGELYQMQLDADLVVLSACETNVGISRRGEGVQSLSRGFFYAGARSLLASQWQVSDQSTRQLMDVFYQALDQGATKDDALRQAKLRLLEDGWEPYFWAGFSLIGQAQPVQLYAKPGYGWVVVAVVSLALLLSIRLFRRRKVKPASNENS
ncbi:MAG: CHAT domain-containing protein, partial [Bacteroidota bacterium]